MAEERVQKILARAGYGSRRASEELITSGRVKVNGQVAVLGSRADPNKDTITVDNQQIAREQEPIYIALNKPTGILSEVSPEEPRQTVRDLIPVPGHMFIVGRLDMESEGLILLTNDGELANKLTHPRYGHEKEYRVLVGQRPDSKQLDAWRHGVVLEDGYRTAPALVRMETVAGKGAWLRVILREGRKRQIREMGRQTGLPVLRILRIRIGSLLLGDLKPGEWRHLKPDEVRALRVSKPQGETPFRASPGRRAGIGRPARSAAGTGPRGPRQGLKVTEIRPARRGEGARANFREETGETPRYDREPREERSGRPERPGRSTRTGRPSEGGRPASAGRTGGAGRSTGVGRSAGSDRAGGPGRPGSSSGYEGFNRRDDDETPTRGPSSRTGGTGRSGGAGRTGSSGRTGGAGRTSGTGRAGNAGRTSSRPGGPSSRPAGRRPRPADDRPGGSDRRPGRPARSPKKER